ncbi:MAG: CRISPR-associated protein [Ignavibacteria bacterium]|nr:MAG: CRISPR-associated protein [Ignavibacteria bacterium]KAF0158110.1 MAG: CRISPR-associated protein [Ignavibacteria bacterium]
MSDSIQSTGFNKAVFWIANGLDVEAIQFAELFGKELTAPTMKNKEGKEYKNKNEALTTSQIRNIYGEVQRLKMKGYNQSGLLLLKPRLAYSTERKGTQGSKDFRSVIEKAIDCVLDGKDEKEKQIRFENFANFFEAILAYHRSFGGK